MHSHFRNCPKIDYKGSTFQKFRLRRLLNPCHRNLCFAQHHVRKCSKIDSKRSNFQKNSPSATPEPLPLENLFCIVIFATALKLIMGSSFQKFRLRRLLNPCHRNLCFAQHYFRKCSKIDSKRSNFQKNSPSATPKPLPVEPLFCTKSFSQVP